LRGISSASGNVLGSGSVRDTGGPVFVLTVARSGSTLLRFILDAHPDLCCPPELGVAAACSQLAHLWTVTEGARSASPPAALESGQLTGHAATAIRSAIESALEAYQEDRGATRWCDKSLDNALWADVVAVIWPDAQFICLYRHSMDVIASGLEACRWGLDSFGFELYAPQYPGNSVAAAGAYWADTTGKMIDFEKRFPDRTLRVRYEDLVTDPEDVAGQVFSFLGVAQVPGISRSCFAVAHEANGPGDAKIWFTTEVSSGSVGRGLEVPGARLPPPLRAAINDALRELSYVEVGEDWNCEQKPGDLRNQPGLPQPQDKALAAKGPEGRPGVQDAELMQVASAVQARISAVSPAMLEDIASCWPALAGRELGVEVIGPAGGLAEFSWNIPGPAGSGGEQIPPAMLSAPVSVWRPVLDGAENLFGELFARRIIARAISNAHLRRTEEVHALGVLLGVAQLPAVVRRRAAPKAPAASLLVPSADRAPGGESPPRPTT
jgi:hypothetical protein